MTLRQRDLAAHTRDASVRDRGSRRFDRAVHARRRLNVGQVSAGTKADRNGPNPRYKYLTQTHD
jgi:hypothetical protein